MRKELFQSCLALVACACATGYQPKAWHNPTGGYSDEKLADDTFRVSFLGNGVTSYERASDFAMLRAAELALEHGFNYFVIGASERGAQTGYVTTTGPMSTAGPVSIGFSVSAPVSYPNPSYTIICYEELPETDAEVTDARALRDSLRWRYQLPTDEQP